MALIECYECKRSISSEASACIHCGAPAREQMEAAHAPVSAATISFGSLPRNNAVPEAYVAQPEPAPMDTPAASGPRRRSQPAHGVEHVWNADGSRPVEGWLKIMVFLLPIVFVWFLLRRGHSLKQRFFGFGWLALLILASRL